MSIELYDRAAVIKKDGVKYYLVKHGSKNSFTCPGQYRTDGNFKRQYLRREARDSDWHLVAYGDGYMSDTSWNAPTGYIYGRIAFGNKRNIALALDKMKPRDYESYDEEQRANIDKLLNHAKDIGYKYSVNLAGEIPSNDLVKVIHNQGTERELRMYDHKIDFEGRSYWNLDNL